MTDQPHHHRVAIGLLLCALLVLPVFGARAQDGRALANLSFGSTTIDFQPRASYERATLTVSVPGGQVLRQEIGGGAPISFEIFDKAGHRLPDGEYRWELVVAPQLSGDARERLARARAAGDDTAAAAIAGSEPRLQSGSFRVVDGAIVTPGGVEPQSPRLATRAPGDPQLATRDQVIPDDLIVQGSACIGLDCVNNESFGFDTIRLKENNTRIKFEDTSVGSFPTNDWQLTANDSASGASSKFSIEDITGARVPFTVTAGAATNSIFVDSTGRVGFRTSTPVLDLHVNTSNTPALRLEQNSSGGFTAQTWDIAGNEANFFVRDVTGGSRLPLRIRPGAPTSSVDISSDGNVGIGTASPSFKIDATGNGANVISTTAFSNTDNGDLQIRRARGTSSVPTAVQLNDVVGGITMMGHNGTAFSGEIVSIDARAEENFTTTANGTRLTFQTTTNGQTTSSTKMVIRQNGRVGIGTVSPTELLHVAGNVLVTGGAFIDDGTTLNAPDYVFEPDYKLMPIAELGQFVETNRHLPNVPSSAEIKSTGLNLSQFQMRLLEKVEELTLYTLDQHQTIQQLSAHNAELEARLQAIEAALLAKQ